METGDFPHHRGLAAVNARRAKRPGGPGELGVRSPPKMKTRRGRFQSTPPQNGARLLIIQKNNRKKRAEGPIENTTIYNAGANVCYALFTDTWGAGVRDEPFGLRDGRRHRRRHPGTADGLTSGYFLRRLTAPRGRRYSTDMDRRGDSLSGAGIRRFAEKGNSYPSRGRQRAG